MRILSYNIKSLLVDPEAVRDVIVETSPDVVLVQEPCRYLSGGRRRMRRLAQDAGMVCVIPGGSPFGAYTTAVLVSPGLAVRMVARRGRPLSWRWWRRRDLVAWPTRRGCALVDLGEVVVISVHLGLDARERAEHCAEVNALVTLFGAARCIVGADVNEDPADVSTPSWRTLGSQLRDAGPDHAEKTFAAPRPTRRIDGVFVGSGLMVVDAQVVTTPAALRGSDHLPLCVDLRSVEAQPASAERL